MLQFASDEKVVLEDLLVAADGFDESHDVQLFFYELLASVNEDFFGIVFKWTETTGHKIKKALDSDAEFFSHADVDSFRLFPFFAGLVRWIGSEQRGGHEE